MNKTQLTEHKHVALPEDNLPLNQPIEIISQEYSHPMTPQTPPDEKWDTIKHVVSTAGMCACFAIVVLGTRGRTVKFNGSIGPLKFVTTLSRSVAAAA